MREGLDAYAGTTRNLEDADEAGRGHERVRVFGIDAALDRVTGEDHLALLESEPGACRYANLFFDDVDAGHHFGDGVLNLETRIRLHEIEIPLRVHQELECAGVRVVHRARRFDDDATHLAAHLLGERQRRRLLEQLLVASLDGALALAEVDDVTVAVAEDLELDVAWRLDVLLDVDVADTEGGLGLALRGLDCLHQFARRAHDAHAASAAAGGGLDDDRIADLLGDLEGLLLALDRAVATRQDRHARLLHHATCAGLVAHQANDLWVGADELDMAGFADFREVGAFREEPVAGVNGVGAGHFGCTDDRRHIQVAVGAAGWADADVFIGKPHVERVLIGLGVDRHGLDTEFAARVDDTHRHFAPVGYQDLLEHLLCADGEQALAVLHRLPVLDVDVDDFAFVFGVDFIHQLHRLDDAENLSLLDR